MQITKLSFVTFVKNVMLPDDITFVMCKYLVKLKSNICRVGK